MDKRLSIQINVFSGLSIYGDVQLYKLQLKIIQLFLQKYENTGVKFKQICCEHHPRVDQLSHQCKVYPILNWQQSMKLKAKDNQHDEQQIYEEEEEKGPMIKKLKQKILARTKTQERIQSLKQKISQKAFNYDEPNEYQYQEYPNPFEEQPQPVKFEQENSPVRELNYNQFYGQVLQQPEPQPFEQVFQTMAPRGFTYKRLLRRKLDERRVRVHLHPETLKQAIKMFKTYDERIEQGVSMSLNTIARVLGCSCSMVWNLYKEYHQDPFLTERYAKIRKREQPMRKLKIERMKCILRIVQNNPYLTQKELSNILNQIEYLKPRGKEMSSHIMTQLLRPLGYFKVRTFSSPADRNRAQFIEKRFKYCNRLLNIKKQSGKVYYFDYEKFNCYSVRERIWLKKSQTRTEYPITRDNNIEILAIMAENGVVKWQIRMNEAITHDLNQVIDMTLTNLLQTEKETTAKKYMMVNNTRLTDSVKDLIFNDSPIFTKHSILLDSLPEKSHQLNPLHSWFHELKIKIRSKKCMTQDDLFNQTKALLQAMTNVEGRQLYQRVDIFVEKAIKRETF